VRTDENRLRQILINLLSNAIKFTQAGHVALRMRYHNQVATFEIEDTGVGIDRNDLDRIFEPFERAHAPDIKAPAGTGLGLTITRMLAETMGGQVTVSSELGKGSVFRVRLLLSEVARPRATTPIERRIHGYRGARKTALVADDDPIHRNLLHEILLPLGFTVLSAPDGLACLDMAEQYEPDLILLDVFMPAMNGWDVAATLRARGHARTAIIMLSANISEAHRLLTPERPHDDYMMKPIDIRQLLDKIRSLLKIEWTYEADDEDGAPLVDVPLSADDAPVRRHIEDLLHLGQIGYVRGIQAKLVEIEGETPQHQAFVTQMRDLVKTYDLKRLVAVLEGLRGHDAR
jgi:CheY-like chemotaxis protein/anti-sigma regulatory factor (Ser/Thr protein kinase)